jgi:hypothetical protein
MKKMYQIQTKKIKQVLRKRENNKIRIVEIFDLENEVYVCEMKGGYICWD